MKTVFALCLGLWMFLAQAAPYLVTVDTTPLAGRAGHLAFDLLGGSPLQDNRLEITGFASDAALLAGTSSGSVSGSLAAGPLVLRSNTDFFNEWLQQITFGTTLSFVFSLTGNFAGGAPDNFSLYLLDDALQPFATSDPSGSNAALSFDIVGAGGAPRVFTSASFTVSASPVGLAVPTPGTLALASLPLLVVAVITARRPRRRLV